MLRLFCRRFSSTGRLSVARSACVAQKPADDVGDSIGDQRESNAQMLMDMLDGSTVGLDSQPTNQDDQWSTLPYVQGTFVQRESRTEIKPYRPKMNPEDTSIILFPGYGSQFVGMARSLKAIPAARDIFDCASEIMGYDIFKMCEEGPQKQLNKTTEAHIAIVVASLAHVERMKEMRPNSVRDCVGSAGFGVGEITSLIFAGALEFEQALHLVKLRAEALEAAAEMSKGGMATIFYGADSKVKEACIAAKKFGQQSGNPNAECTISNYMYPNYKVISGTDDALQFIADNVSRFRLRGIKRIRYSLPLNCGLMRPAAEPFIKALDQMTVNKPLIRVYSNYDSQPYMTEAHIRRNLPKTLYNPVRWEQTIHQIYSRRIGNRFPRTYTCGPGCGLRSILKNINIKAWKTSSNVGDVKEVRIEQTRKRREAEELHYQRWSPNRAAGVKH